MTRAIGQLDSVLIVPPVAFLMRTCQFCVIVTKPMTRGSVILGTSNTILTHTKSLIPEMPHDTVYISMHTVETGPSYHAAVIFRTSSKGSAPPLCLRGGHNGDTKLYS